MGNGKFFALLARQKYINRWGLMRSLRSENVAEHTLDTAQLAHALALINNRRCGGNADIGKTVLLAMYHDTPEIFTGDLPTPVKYDSEGMRLAFREVEDAAVARLVRTMPDDLKSDYLPLLSPDTDCIEHRLVKAADKISALIKCREELAGGNREFAAAERAQLDAVQRMGLAAADIFVREYAGFYSDSIDTLTE